MSKRGKKEDGFQTFVFCLVIFALMGFAAIHLIGPTVKGWF